MMTSNGFAALMKLSQAQTQESTRAADTIQAERRRKEEERRQQKREKERQAKREQEREAKVKEMERREEEQRQALLYGPKRDNEADTGLSLTREEKRERRLQLQFSQNAARRAGSSVGTSKVGRRLPGGAYNVTTSSSQTSEGSVNGGRSVRARLTAMPNTLTKLNTQTLEGEEAREFHDWFGTKPKGATSTKTGSLSPPAASGASTPSIFPHRPDAASSTAPRKPSSPRTTSSKPPSLPPSRSPQKIAAKSSSALATKLSRPPSHKTVATSSAPPPPSQKKRPRSPPSAYSESESESDYDRRSHKRAPAAAANGIQDEIWKIFGRDRSKYVSRDVMSDDEDMEVDMNALEREELTSARIARKEDLEAEEAERRHEEEKRRRRKERERSG
ncbi:hypothetical protein B0F90DRAFT_1748423 [Multifurca ochricompacta]|uniref:SPT2 chromatin protein n=1 Tax=Multifurca ochricompacta TaxID=376703 RepID=A0AAD4QLA2_9AGAM|nr:hypothetical protein B0F90DRAFT_1748423 [Multifurca ochricompacta]